jgi:hypothetical protein
MDFDKALELFKRESLTIEMIGDKIDMIFKNSCTNGYLEFAKWLWESSNHKIDLSDPNEWIFTICCAKGLLQMVKWLWIIRSGKISFHINHEMIFRTTCCNGKLDVAKWLWEFSNKSIKISALYDESFQSSYDNGHLQIVQWLWITSCNCIHLQNVSDIGIMQCSMLNGTKAYNYPEYTYLVDHYMRHHYYKPFSGPGYLIAIRID